MHFVAASLLLAFFITGCLTVEKREVRIRLSDDHSGEATILFLNIESESDDTTNSSQQDFTELVKSYLTGDQLERDNPRFRNVHKRLFEKDGMLVGEVRLSFDSLSTLRLYKYDRNSPYMMFLGAPSSNEILEETNGVHGGDLMPVIFWPSDARDFYIRTKAHPGEHKRHSLLKYFHTWEQTGVLPESPGH